MKLHGQGLLRCLEEFRCWHLFAICMFNPSSKLCVLSHLLHTHFSALIGKI